MPKRKMMLRAIVVIAMTTLWSLQASNATGVLFFSGAHATKHWAGPGVHPLQPTQNLRAGGAGLTFPLRMHKTQGRLYWETSVDLNLAAWPVIKLDIQIDNPAAVKRVAIYFRSGDGWYGGWFDVQGTDWQTITLSRTDFQPEGNPAGWDTIRAIRIAFWKQASIKTVARIASFHATHVPILILRNTDASDSEPKQADFANRLSDRLQLWLRQYGIPAAVITDDELRQAPPAAGTRLLILPYNPVMTQQVAQQLTAFTRQGGKIIALYALNEHIAPLLGIKSWQWKRADPVDAFAFMQFAAANPYALPERVAQDSWNINHPILTTARVLATWQNGQGENSTIPAVTVSTNGTYIGHVLTNTGREEKMQMLMGLMAMLVPDLAPQLSAIALARATSLLEHTDWKSTKTFLLQAADKHNRRNIVQTELQEITQNIRRLQERLPNLTYPQTLQHTRYINDRIQQLAHRTLSPRNSAHEEFRGVWAHAAEGIRGMPWDDSMQHLKQAGMNNLFVNVLWGGAAFYPSKVLPTVAERQDFAQEVVDAGRKHDVTIHAWMVLWSLQHAPDDFTRKARQQNRLAQDQTGKQLHWLCPSNPENRKKAVDAAVEIVLRYPFDGFHLDYIRYPDAHTCFCSGCKERFTSHQKTSFEQWPDDVNHGPYRQAWLEWRREIINSLVAEIQQHVREARPDISLSAAVWAGWPSVRDSLAQDWPHWAEQGWIDFFTPMNYVATAEEAVQRYRTQRAAVPASVPIYPGLAPSTMNLSPATTLWHINQLREAGAPGFVLFDLDRDLLQQHLPALNAGATP